MSITRKFLGFDGTPLRLAVDYLVTRYGVGQNLDLSGTILVLPGGRAGRRLLEILVERAETDALILMPPTIATVGRLPEHLYQPQRPFASDLVQHLVWAQSLESAEPAVLTHILPEPPAKDDQSRWLELGELLRQQHIELAADGLHFGDVVDGGKSRSGGFPDAKRWRALREIQLDYLRRLDQLQLWDIQTARLVAIEKGECQVDRDILLMGTVDLNVASRRMIDQVADRVTAIVFSPDNWSDRFDEHGCLIPGKWQDTIIPIDDGRVHLAEGPSDQADRAVRCLAEYQGQYRPDEITIGLADEQLTTYLERMLEQNDIPSRPASGISLTDTGPYRLLDAITQYLQTCRLADFSALVRHPDFHRWLDHDISQDWLEDLDDFHHHFLQPRLDANWPRAAERFESVKLIFNRVRELLKDMYGPAKPLDQWNEPLAHLLKAIYGGQNWNRDDPDQRTVLRSLEQFRDTMMSHTEKIPRELMPVVNCSEAIEWILQQLQSVTIALPVGQPAVELLGWLELPLDDAPALVVCSFNEGFVPSSVNSDVFLPNALRSELGLQDNLRRYARDAYALCVLQRTRRQIDLIVGRRDSNNDPLRPSRLLFATDPETTARRAKRCFSPATPTADLPPLAGNEIAPDSASKFYVPRPSPLAEPIEALSVTAFRDYIECPYRFYLGRVMGLEVVDDRVEELDGGEFGNLMHKVLQRFGDAKSPIRDSSDASEIAAFLNRTLDDCVGESYGRRPLPAVNVQVEQLRLRLNAFAEKQAEWVTDGWRIQYTEIAIPGSDHHEVTLDVDDQPLALRGRIDRIDVNRQTGTYAVLDYKSSDAGKTPEQTHRYKQQWCDLQLPLYRHLVGGLKHLGIDGPVELGYVLLPKNTRDVRFCLADWSAEELAAADDVAFNVVRDIRNEKFWPPSDDPAAGFGQFAAICQDGVFGRALEPESRAR